MKKVFSKITNVQLGKHLVEPNYVNVQFHIPKDSLIDFVNFLFVSQSYESKDDDRVEQFANTLKRYYKENNCDDGVIYAVDRLLKSFKDGIV